MKLGTVASKYALRSLARHPRRTALSMIGAGIGCAMALVAMSWMGGATEMQIQAIAESGGGHLRIVHEQWPDTRENMLRLSKWRETQEVVDTLQDLVFSTPRARANGLLAFGNRSAGVQMTGVVPSTEYASNRVLRRSHIEGAYLDATETGAVVIGRSLARRLDVQLGDDLYATVSGKDDIHSAMLHIVGIVDTGSQELDLGICHVLITDLENMTGMEGTGEISIILNDPIAVNPAMAHLAASLPEGNTVITWRKISPELSANIDGDMAFMRLLTLIVIIIVSLGIASAQLTAVLERRAEFAVLSALGMRSGQIILMVMIEALVVGAGGAGVALITGGTGAWYLSKWGVDLGALMGGDLGFADVLFDPFIYGSFGAWLIPYAVVISMTATVVATLYPAWRAAHITPADALRMV